MDYTPYELKGGRVFQRSFTAERQARLENKMYHPFSAHHHNPNLDTKPKNTSTVTAKIFQASSKMVKWPAQQAKSFGERLRNAVFKIFNNKKIKRSEEKAHIISNDLDTPLANGNLSSQPPTLRKKVGFLSALKIHKDALEEKLKKSNMDKKRKFYTLLQSRQGLIRPVPLKKLQFSEDETSTLQFIMLV